jgi:citrate synthase
LPARGQLQEFIHTITHKTFVHENIKKFIDGFHHDAHPMGILVGTVGALSTFNSAARNFIDPVNRRLQMARLIAKMPTLAAFASRHSRGLPHVYPDNDLSYAGNFLNMMWKMSEPKYQPDPVLEHALDVLFILHADHEQNCSTNAMRAVGSSRVDPYSAATAAVAALYGPLHGGANEQVLRMLHQIGSVTEVPKYVSRGQAWRVPSHGVRPPGVQELRPTCDGHPGASRRGVQGDRHQPAARGGGRAGADRLGGPVFRREEALPQRRLLHGHHLRGHGLPVEMFPVLFAIGRMPGWLAQWEEGLLDLEQKIARPRQLYIGEDERRYISLDERENAQLDLVEPPPKPIGGD